MKKYINPMLSIVSINKNDIIVTSQEVTISGSQNNSDALGAGRRFDDWDAGY